MSIVFTLFNITVLRHCIPSLFLGSELPYFSRVHTLGCSLHGLIVQQAVRLHAGKRDTAECSEAT